MIRAKKQFKCSACGDIRPAWEGMCRACGETLTYEEEILRPVTSKPRETPSQKYLRVRSKKSEREIARKMITVDGIDPKFTGIASSTGRVGFITGMRIDGVSKNYVTENKNRKLPTWMIKAWVLILQRSLDFQKHVLFHLDPPNLPKEFIVNGQKFKTDTMAVITQTRHEELIRAEQLLTKLEELIFSDLVYSSLQKEFQPPK